MQNKNEKRSSGRGIGRRCRHTPDMFGGVGGRQAKPSPQPGGGGYQNICTVLNFDASAAEKKRDPRLVELREMGLQRVWLDVAEEIGVDEFLKVWRLLSSDDANIDSGRLMIPIRSYSTYLRYQRNRYIESLADMGFTASAIKDRVNKQLGEKLSDRHLSRLKSKAI